MRFVISHLITFDEQNYTIIYKEVHFLVLTLAWSLWRQLRKIVEGFWTHFVISTSCKCYWWYTHIQSFVFMQLNWLLYNRKGFYLIIIQGQVDFHGIFKDVYIYWLARKGPWCSSICKFKSVQTWEWMVTIFWLEEYFRSTGKWNNLLKKSLSKGFSITDKTEFTWLLNMLLDDWKDDRDLFWRMLELL